VPYSIFLTGSAVGLLPWTYLLVKTGLTLSEIKNLGFDVTTLGSLMALALVALLPTLLNKKLNENKN
jgi:membrane protein DedA with SNARE-associated domain